MKDLDLELLERDILEGNMFGYKVSYRIKNHSLFAKDMVVCIQVGYSDRRKEMKEFKAPLSLLDGTVIKKYHIVQ